MRRTSIAINALIPNLSTLTSSIGAALATYANGKANGPTRIPIANQDQKLAPRRSSTLPDR